MSESYDRSMAVVLLPEHAASWPKAPSLRRWLVRGDVSQMTPRANRLASVLNDIGIEAPDSGLGALRFWGQTGDRPAAWIAAADPVYLEPRLDHLRLHALPGSGVTSNELRALVDDLQGTLGGDGGLGFARLGDYAYVTAEKPMLTASLPACAVDGEIPTEHLPDGKGAPAHRNLTSEIEMTLHNCAVNRERLAQGKAPVNSLWVWGGGFAPDSCIQPLPPLYSNDPLLSGFWLSRTGVAESWCGSIDSCLEKSIAGFVATVDIETEDFDLIEQSLASLHEALNSGRLSRLVLRFADGPRVELRKRHALRFWRRAHRLPEAETTQ